MASGTTKTEANQAEIDALVEVRLGELGFNGLSGPLNDAARHEIESEVRAQLEWMTDALRRGSGADQSA